jgi:hypothetical protein
MKSRQYTVTVHGNGKPEVTVYDCINKTRAGATHVIHLPSDLGEMPFYTSEPDIGIGEAHAYLMDTYGRDEAESLRAVPV